MLKYRADIDGLRAFSVVAVVLYHYFPNYFPSGFVGVDIFFVISGYLITLIISKESQEQGFSYKRFYQRRIIRIFPTLLFTLLAVIIYAWFTSLQNDYKQIGKHVFGASFFISNILFWRESGYFDTQAIYKPLLNIWSLGIEEQFYILWPTIYLFFARKKELLF